MMRRSIFGSSSKRIDGKKKKRQETFVDVWVDKTRYYLAKLLPIDIPPDWQLAIGLMNVILITAVFFSLFLTSYYQTVQTVYLAPVSGTTPDPNCELIPQANTGTFLATMEGIWQSSADFSYVDAAYSLSITGLTVSLQDYQGSFDYVYAALLSLGNVMKTQNLAHNLLIWMTVSFVQGASQRLTMTGTPLNVFNRQFHDASMGSVDGLCAVNSLTTFDTSNGLVTTTYEIDDFLADTNCANIMNPNIYGYNTRSKPSDFSLVFDIRTLITAVAVNYGYTTLDTLVAIPKTSFNFTSFGTNVEAQWLYDPRYPGMAPLSCTSNSPTTRAVCIIGIGETPAFPFVLHSGMNNSGIPEPCLCPSLTTEELMNPYHPCHQFAFRYGFFHWNTAEPTPVFEFAQHLLLNPFYMDNMFNATVLSTPVWSDSPAYANDFNNSAYREAQFAYCNTLSYGYCRVFVINAFDLFNIGFTVSPNYYQLIQGACRDSISVSSSIWDKLIATPFAPLVQEYEKCRYSFSYAISNNLGVTLGNLSVYTPACILVLGLLVWLYKHSGFYVPPPHESYTSRDREEAMETLAVAMLMVRDGRYDQRALRLQVSSMSSNVQLKVLESLVKELQQHAEETSSCNNGQNMGFLVHSKSQQQAVSAMTLYDMSKGSEDGGSEIDDRDNQIAMKDAQDALELQPLQLSADEEKRSEHDTGTVAVEDVDVSSV